MEKPDLYICHTVYHLLIALVRAVRAGGGQAVWLSEQIPGAAALAASGRLSHTAWPPPARPARTSAISRG